MSGRYLLAPEAATDLVQIWRYIKKQSSVAMADRVESVILDRIRFLAENPGAGHWRRNLTELPVKFSPYTPTSSSIGLIPSRSKLFPSCMGAVT